ncbi:YdeI/OmpD-associated family protein [Paraprevotella xylaniphila]|uniref:YdeI/OmpD-associated family protein n=1 Tax=Paraprevotella xylaniphila TaxID=454155 RepID=UPI001032AFA8|nr:YdeI/OmpD-associated family protein [Paraprevotella xylaniphila]
MDNLLNVCSKDEFRQWLIINHTIASECWVNVKRGKPSDDTIFWYIDAVEEALCFGWIDSTLKRIDGIAYQRFAPRRKGSVWSELNKERCRRMEYLGRMTDAGRIAYPKNMDSFLIDNEILKALKEDETVWSNFSNFPPLYQRVRIDTIQIKKTNSVMFANRLSKFIENTRNNIMFGEWNDNGRLIGYRKK